MEGYKFTTTKGVELAIIGDDAVERLHAVHYDNGRG